MASPSDWLTRRRADAREIMSALRPRGHEAMFAPTAPVRERQPVVPTQVDADVRRLLTADREPARSGR